MKIQRLLLFSFILGFSFLAIGCSGEGTERTPGALLQPDVDNDSQNQEIIVEQRVGDDNTYEFLNEITATIKVQKAKEIIKNTEWTNAKVDMFLPPDYKFHFEFPSKDLESNSSYYLVWISPNNDRLEIVIEGKDKYAPLTIKNSAILYVILTGERLDELN